MTRAELASLLASRGLAPRKRAGQHFLIDPNALRAIVRDAALPAGATVLEVGPGPGLLTEHLLDAGHRVLAVEIDRGLSTICRERFGAIDQFTLVEGDVLQGRRALSPRVVEPLSQEREIHVVANLPYNIASTVILLLLEADLPIATSTTLIQLEVAQRLVAEPSTEPYGQLSVLVQTLAEGRITRRVTPKVFWPEPKVESAVLRLSRLPSRPDRDEYERLKALSKAVFQHRRKTLVHTLKESGTSPETAREALRALGLPLDARPERLSPAEFRLLARSLPATGRQA